MSGRQRAVFIFWVVAVYANPNPLLAADWCVGTATQLTQALLGAGSNGEADVIRLQAGTYRSTQAAGFTATLAGHALELSGGWASGCLFRQRGAHSTIDGEYERPAMRISGSISQPRTVRVAHLAFIRGVDDEVGGLAISSTGVGNLNVEIEDCRFHDNTQTDIEDVIGGGLYVNADEVSVLGNVFTDNHAGNLGGAGAITCFGSLGAFTNNTVVRNTARFGQADVRGGMMLTGNCLWEVANNILWDNEGYDLQIGDGEATLRNNNLDDLVGTPMASSGNVNIDPQFVSIGILRLQRSSPMIDAGLNETLLGLPQYSFDGGIRIAGPRIDIGAYELDVLFEHDFDPLFGLADGSDAR
jgi:putative cofactor-binding repeat protein